MMTTNNAQYRVKASDLKPQWHLIDAEGQTLGRFASEIAVLLMGKHKPLYVPNLITGDFVIVINAEKIRVTGNKLQQKRYYRHSGYHGGLKERTLEALLATSPTRALERAVKGMLPKNKLGRHMLARLKLYAGTQHGHEAQLNAGARAARAEAAALRQAGASRTKSRSGVATKAKTAVADVEKADVSTPEADLDKPAERRPRPSKKATTARTSKTGARASSAKTGRASKTSGAGRRSWSTAKPADSKTEDA